MNPPLVPSRDPFSRRNLLTCGAAALGASYLSSPCATAASGGGSDTNTFRFGLNFSTIRGQDLSLVEEVDAAGKAGYDAIEPWLGKLHRYVDEGGSLRDLRTRIEDYGMTVESAIGFAKWIVDDDAERKKGVENAKRDMEILAKIGGKRIAAPPAGIPRGSVVSLDNAADRYRDLLKIGDGTGVVPQIEMWGGNPSIGTVSKAVYVAVRAGHPKACFLGDVFHGYKGGSSFEGLRMLSPGALQVYHFNDYPAEPPRDKIGDADRVHVGDGVAPIGTILQIFKSVGATPVLSLELFNREYWKQPATEVAKTGLAKMKAAVAKAG